MESSKGFFCGSIVGWGIPIAETFRDYTIMKFPKRMKFHIKKFSHGPS